MQLSRRSAVKALLATTAGGWTPASMAIASERQGAIGSIEEIKTEVCVIGGGSGGVGAALAAARAGARVLLIESESILGGTSTNAWVHTWEPTAGADGLPREIYERMRQDPLGVTIADYDRGAPRRGGQGLPFEPRTFDFAVREMLDETGKCTTLLGTTFCGTRVRGDRLQTVEAWFAAKRLVIEADVFVDCTADGYVSASAGCEYQMGEDPKSLYSEPSAPENAEMALNGLTLCYRITDTGVNQKPYLPKGVKEGICPRPAHIVAMPNGDHLVNAVNMIDGNAVLCVQYSELMREAQRRVLEHFHWLQNPGPGDTSHTTRLVRGTGYGTWTISGVAPRIGVRETRRILGDYVLNENDCQAGVANQKHKDIIAITDHSVDIHGRKGRLYELPNGPYGVPYRCLLPRGVQNLMIASRAASFSHIAASSCRLCRTMMTLGQAAGNAAAMCVQEHAAPRELDVNKLQHALQSQGVALSASDRPRVSAGSTAPSS
ncbi:MAG: FAD-dependent oxidoreductase [Planctomycetia bacterium]|nr:FAD-dependent oxidoreductase [Planctomycetia bacterium]